MNRSASRPTPIVTAGWPIAFATAFKRRNHPTESKSAPRGITIYMMAMSSHRFVLIVWLLGVGAGGCAENASVPAAPVSDSHPGNRIAEQPVAEHPLAGRPGLKLQSVPPRAAREGADVVAARGIAFSDVAGERGLDCVWPRQPRPMTALHAFGSGCAAFDADNDGWQDVLLVCDPHPRLYRNLGGTHFEEVTAASGLGAVAADWAGCAIGDYNADGLLDVLVTGYRRLALYKNTGNMRFELATTEAGLDAANEGCWGSSAGFMDLDGDGWLDLVILNYVVFDENSQQYCEYAPGVKSGCNPKIYPPERGRIWRNTGAGAFLPVPREQGMNDTHGIALVLAFSDLDQDGRMDFYIGNDGIPADLMHNRGQMQFENIAPLAGVAISDNSTAVSAMGADWDDFDHDGFLDLAVTNWQGKGFVLFRGLGRNLFVDDSRKTGLARSTMSRLGFGAKWVDFDNDGWSDLFFVNGHVYDNSAEIHGPQVPFRQPSALFWNDEGKKLVDITSALGADVNRTTVGRGSATADFNNDGRVDLLAVDFEGPVMLLENRTQSSNHWLTLDLRGNAPNLFAYGARVTGRSGNRVWLAEVSPTSSYLSSSDLRIHWGLGEQTSLDSLTIRWPSGREQTLQHVMADQILQVREPVETTKRRE
jgi:hypothetical protein